MQWRVVLVAQLKCHGNFGAGEGVGVLGAVDATAIDLVDNLGLFNLAEAERTEELGFEGEHNGLHWAEAFNALQDKFHQLFAHAFAAEVLVDGH